MVDFQSTLERHEAGPGLGASSRKRKLSDEDEGKEGDNAGDSDREQEEYSDDFTKRQFGADAVVVSTTLGLDDGDDGNGDEMDALRELAAGAPKVQQQRQAGPKLKKAHKSVNTKAAAKYNKHKHGGKGKNSKGGKRKGGPGRDRDE